MKYIYYIINCMKGFITFARQFTFACKPMAKDRV